VSLRIAVTVVGLLLSSPIVRPQSTPTYTNADLERIQPYRNETGVASVPAFQPEPARAEPKSRASRGGPEGEAYWRQEARRVHERQRSLEDQIERLRATLDRPRAKSHDRSGQATPATSQDASLRRRIATLEQRKRELESDLDDRARRARVLPGWLRE
jgi:hypothetical protein